MNLEDIVRSIRNKFSFKKAGHAILAAAEAVGSRPYGQPTTSLSAARTMAAYYDKSYVQGLQNDVGFHPALAHSSYAGMYADYSNFAGAVWDPDEGRKVLGPLQDSLGVIDTRSEI